MNTETYLSLAPTDLKVVRQNRYDGGGYSVRLKDFAPEDVSHIIQLYNAVKRIYDLWLYMRERPNFDLLQETIVKIADDDFISLSQSVGSFTYDSGIQSPMLRKVVHDIHGGSLTGLIGYATLLQEQPRKSLYIRKAIYLARDHAKMMRNAIVDLDVQVRRADESAKIHSITDFIDKLEEFRYQVASKSISIDIKSDFHGDISNRCLETSAIDRILYNLINNAGRFTCNNSIQVHILPVNDRVVRWVVRNAIHDEHKQWLIQKYSDSLHELFLAGTTRGSQGLGLSTCADFISSCFGVHPPAKAVEKGYIGARVIDNEFYAWFHWPIYVSH